MSYRVSTQVYSGPFDLLLQLVTRQKVDIGAISISEVAEQYLAEAERIEALDLDVASDFLLVAATLLDIKAASLVPQEAPSKSVDDDEDDEDLEELSALDGDALREVLIQRLIAYKQFKGAAAALGARMQAESRMHPRVAGPDPEFLGLMPDYLAGITLRGLAVICADLDGKRQTFLLEAEHVAPHRVPLDLTVASVDRFTMAHQTCTFRELLDGDATTEQLVVTFLAMLELTKRGSLTLSQDEIFGTIRINRVERAEAYVPGEGPELTE
ncbi:MAG: segregation/condensation protein A [Collinsella sp.]|nr:segregation/condensation protein A [Collinsella sp.]